MKPNFIYIIHADGHKLLNDFRGDKTYGDRYLVQKTDKNDICEQEYEVIISSIADFCDCLGGYHHGSCKHIKMVHDFIEINENE